MWANAIIFGQRAIITALNSGYFAYSFLQNSAYREGVFSASAALSATRTRSSGALVSASFPSPVMTCEPSASRTEVTPSTEVKSCKP